MYKARAKTYQQIYGKLEDQYGHLWDYCETLRKTNKGSCVMIKVDKPDPYVAPKFGRLYFSFATMKNGFLDGCRPVIGMDGCFLKGPLKGQLLTAVGRDVNNNMYPIAFGVIEAENRESWTWFWRPLYPILEYMNGVVDQRSSRIDRMYDVLDLVVVNVCIFQLNKIQLLLSCDFFFMHCEFIL
jgi:hypothetical protein